MENKEKENPEVLEQPQTSEENTTEQHEEDVKFAHDMLEGMTTEELEAFFEVNGKSIGNMDFDKKLTEEELAEMKDEIFRLNDELMETTEEKANLTKHYGDRIKSLQTQMNTVTTNVKRGTKSVFEPCVKVLDMKGKHVYYFAQSTGQCVLVRGIEPKDLEQEFPFVTVYNVIDENGDKVELTVSRNGGNPEVGDKTSDSDGDYTFDDGTLVTIEGGKIVNIEDPESDESSQDPNDEDDD